MYYKRYADVTESCDLGPPLTLLKKYLKLPIDFFVFLILRLVLLLVFNISCLD